MTVTHSIPGKEQAAAVKPGNGSRAMGHIRDRFARPRRRQPVPGRGVQGCISATSTARSRWIGFYDGDGIYRVRFMPDTQGEWRYHTRSNRAELDGKTGAFTVGRADAGQPRPGPASANTYHFAYADGTPYQPIGTTCYAWTHQADELEEQTLATLAARAVQQDAHVRLPQELRLQQQRAALLPLPSDRRRPKQWQGGYMVEAPRAGNSI